MYLVNTCLDMRRSIKTLGTQSKVLGQTRDDWGERNVAMVMNAEEIMHTGQGVTTKRVSRLQLKSMHTK